MIDTGHRRDYNWMLLPYLRSRGVDRLNGLILTHGDAAHVGGASMLMEDFAPKWVADSFAQDRSPSRREFHAALAAAGVGRRFLCRGDFLELSPGAQLEVIYPPGNWPRALADDKALVFRLKAAGARVLFMADTGFAVEQWLLQNERDLRADIVVKGWPDQDFSGTADFLSAVNPTTVICAAPKFGAGQSFDEWAASLRARGVRIFPQEQCGAVRIQMRADGEISVASWRQPAP
jgi:competence protein ComEC